MHFKTILHDLGRIHQVHHKDMYMLCIWYYEIIIIENKWKCPLYAGSFVSLGWEKCAP